MKKTVCELFAGVGGFRLGFQRASNDWKTVWFNQWEPKRKSQEAYDCYVRHFGNEGMEQTNLDINFVDRNKIPDFNVLVGGFPCQSYSVANSNAKGLDDEEKGSLWWDILDIIRAKKPAFCLFENVDRLLQSPAKQRGRDFAVILHSLITEGYTVQWRVINAADYGCAQRRRRVFILASLSCTSYISKLFLKNSGLDILLHAGFFAKTFPVVKYDYPTQIPFFAYSNIEDIYTNFSGKFYNTGYANSYEVFTVQVEPTREKPIPLGVVACECIDTYKYRLRDDQYEQMLKLKGAKKINRVSKTGHEYVFSEGAISFPDPLDKPARTILTSEGSVNRSSHVISDPVKSFYRFLTPTEVEAIQGFDTGWTEGMSDRMRYFCMGNALVVPLITRMAKTLGKILHSECEMTKSTK